MFWSALKYIIAGILFWLAATFFLSGTQNFIKRSEPAQLIVLALDYRRDSDGGTMYRPVFGLDNTERSRPEYVGNTWVKTPPHKAGEIVSGRYDQATGEMRSDRMIERDKWLLPIAQVLALLVVLQGILMFFGVPEVLLPFRVRGGNARRHYDRMPPWSS